MCFDKHDLSKLCCDEMLCLPLSPGARGAGRIAAAGTCCAIYDGGRCRSPTYGTGDQLLSACPVDV